MVPPPTVAAPALLPKEKILKTTTTTTTVTKKEISSKEHLSSALEQFPPPPPSLLFDDVPTPMPMVSNGCARTTGPVMAPEPARAAPVLSRSGSELANVTPLVPSLLLHEPDGAAASGGSVSSVGDNDSDKSIGEQQDKDIPEEIVVQPSRIVFKDSTAKKED